VKTVSAEPEKPRLGPEDDAARKRAAVEIYTRNETTLRRTARRYSLCADDADDALQRGLEILLRKAPTDDPRELIKWMQTVVKHEALAIRRERERILAGPAAASSAESAGWVDLLPARADGPPERTERREAIARSREALQALKPQELRALTLLAEGYSYKEIGELTGYSQTKINRCLAEGRDRFRKLIARSEDGRRCAELRPLLSAFCDGEARPEDVAQVREHLRACAHCRATLRAYRAAPAAVAALAPALPLDRSLWERVQETLTGLAGRFGGGAGEPVSQAAAGGAGGVGVAGAAKIAAVCFGAAGSAACVATGVVPTPLDLSAAEQERPPRLERRLADLPLPDAPTPTVEYTPAAPEPDPQPNRNRSPASSPNPEPPAEGAPAVAEPAPVSSSGAAEYAPPPPPEPTPEPAPTSSGAGSPAGEFGP
jgi:RNA polymerase sigma factor (sigma-70 family)